MKPSSSKYHKTDTTFFSSTSSGFVPKTTTFDRVPSGVVSHVDCPIQLSILRRPKFPSIPRVFNSAYNSSTNGCGGFSICESVAKYSNDFRFPVLSKLQVCATTYSFILVSCSFHSVSFSGAINVSSVEKSIHVVANEEK